MFYYKSCVSYSFLVVIVLFVVLSDPNKTLYPWKQVKPKANKMYTSGPKVTQLHAGTSPPEMEECIT